MKNFILNLKVSIFLSLLLATTISSQTKIYWVNILDSFTQKIQRADLDGTNVEDVLTNVVSGFTLDNENEKIYWGNFFDGAIKRADLNGTNIEDVLTGLSSPNNIGIDAGGGKIYFTTTDNNFNTKINRANLDGSNSEELIDMGSTSVVDLALDIDSGKVYWKTTQPGNFQRADLDGNNQEVLFPIGGGVGKMEMDLQSGKIYWVDDAQGDPSIRRANIDGTNEESLVSNNPTPVFERPWGIALDLQQEKIYWTDFNAEKIQRADLDGSNVEDVITSGLNSPRDITFGVSGTTAISEEIASIQGNYVLEQNYPNPFNPVTTIEFSLPQPEFVRLTITNILGEEIESLLSEELSPGNYKTKWSASNYPSGVYIAQLQAGTFSQSRKIVLAK